MRIVQGIVAEYNPFHNGHQYQLRASAAATGATHTVCVMSGAFVQRGEPACLHKQARVEMALAGGVDVVLELPAAFACASAESFAAGAVSVLNASGIVDRICFGSESGELAPLAAAAAILADEPPAYRRLLREELDQGLSFAAAREKALGQWLSHGDPPPETVGGVPQAAVLEAVRSPNNILAVAYLKALRRQNSRMIPFTLARRGHGYNDPEFSGSYPSATAIRRALLQPAADPALLRTAVPATTLDILSREIAAGRGPVGPDLFLPMLLQRLRTGSPEQFSQLPDLEPGLIQRVKHAAADAQTYGQLVSAAATSRYPRTRIQRLLAAILLGMTEALARDLRAAGHAQYIRVLGFRDSGRALLADMRRAATLPVLGKSSQWGRYPQPLIQALLTLESNATDTWALACRQPADRRAGWEHRHMPLHMPASRE